MSRIESDGTISPSTALAVVLRQLEVQAGERGDRAAGAEQPQVGRLRAGRCASANSAKLSLTSARIARVAREPRAASPSSPSPLAPTVSVSETTPHGTLCQSRMRGTGAPGSISTSSVEPPPMSKITAGPIPSSSRMWQPSTASRASSCAEITSSRMPVSRRTRSMNSAPLLARRQASVATERARWTLRRLSLSAQILSAPTARSIASSLSRPVWASPSPSRTTRLKASMTTKFSSAGPGDQQAAVVGAEVDRGIGLAAGLRRGPACRRRGTRPRGAVALPVAGGAGAGWPGAAAVRCLASPRHSAARPAD